MSLISESNSLILFLKAGSQNIAVVSLFYIDDTFQDNTFAWNKTFLGKIYIIYYLRALKCFPYSFLYKVYCIFLEEIPFY